MKMAASFAPDEPLRATFLAAAPVRGILGEKNGGKSTRQSKSKRGAVSLANGM
jgi:hypothetical protein